MNHNHKFKLELDEPTLIQPFSQNKETMDKNNEVSQSQTDKTDLVVVNKKL